MNDFLPEPMTPPDCDLRNFPGMMVDVHRLMSSTFNATASRTPLAWMVGHKLWYRAWHQVPAASLPDDEGELCYLSELGFDAKSFRKIRDLAMRGWVKCRDGRLYHPVMAEVALSAWRGKLIQKWRTECQRIKKHNQRHADREPVPAPEMEGWITAGCVPVSLEDPTPSQGTTDECPQGHAANVPRDIVECPQGNDPQGIGIGIINIEPSVLVAGGDVRSAFDEWNDLAKRLGLPIAKDLTALRRKAIKARIGLDGLDRWREALAAVEASSHCRGENDRGWRADLDFVCQAKTFQKLIEGSYGQSGETPGPPRPTAVFAGPPELRAWIVAETSEGFAISYVDDATWVANGRRLVTTTDTAAIKLRRECAAVIKRGNFSVMGPAEYAQGAFRDTNAEGVTA
jgi:hypothetical protein